jgi:hypothetical protein
MIEPCERGTEPTPVVFRSALVFSGSHLKFTSFLSYLAVLLAVFVDRPTRFTFCGKSLNPNQSQRR